MPQRGDVVLVPFPFADQPDRLKLRPALLVQRDGLELDVETLVVVAITSRRHRAGVATRLAVAADSAEGRAMGLVVDSVIMTDRLATIDRADIVRVIGSCPLLTDVDASLRFVLALGREAP